MLALWFMYLYFTIQFLEYRSVTKWVQAATVVYIVAAGLSIIHLALISIAIFRRTLSIKSKSLKKLLPLVVTHAIGCVFVFIYGVLQTPLYFSFSFSAPSFLVFLIFSIYRFFFLFHFIILF